MKTLASREAQNNFGVVLDTAQREPVRITRRGRATAVVVGAEEWQKLTSMRAAAWFQDYSARVAALGNTAASALTDEEVTRMVHELRA